MRKYGQTIVPELLLKGKWLEELGFKAGHTVQIEQRKDKLVITLLK